MTYRDEGAALAHRLQLLEDRIAALEEPLSSLLLDQLAPSLRHELEASQQACARPREKHDEIAGRVELLEAHLVLLERVHAEAPGHEAAYNALPDEVAMSLLGEPTRLPWLAQTPLDGPRALERVPELIRELDPEAEVTVVPELRFVIDARFRHEDTPVVLRVQPYVAGQNTGELELLMATAVRRSTPRLDLRPLAWIHSLTTVLGVHQDVRLGDDEFDNRFLVQGDAARAPRLLPPVVRADLLRIARFDVPSLAVGEGTATLRWLYDCTLPPIEAGVRVLGHLRGLRRRVRMLRSEKR